MKRKHSALRDWVWAVMRTALPRSSAGHSSGSTVLLKSGLIELQSTPPTTSSVHWSSYHFRAAPRCRYNIHLRQRFGKSVLVPVQIGNASRAAFDARDVCWVSGALGAGANLNTRNLKGFTPLLELADSVSANSSEVSGVGVVEALLANKDPESSKPVVNLNSKAEKDKRTAAHIAVDHDNLQLFKTLINNGANLYAKNAHKQMVLTKALQKVRRDGFRVSRRSTGMKDRQGS